MNDEEENELFDSYADDFKEKIKNLNESLDDLDLEKGLNFYLILDKIEFFKKTRISIKNLQLLVYYIEINNLV